MASQSEHNPQKENFTQQDIRIILEKARKERPGIATIWMYDSGRTCPTIHNESSRYTLFNFNLGDKEKLIGLAKEIFEKIYPQLRPFDVIAGYHEGDSKLDTIQILGCEDDGKPFVILEFQQHTPVTQNAVETFIADLEAIVKWVIEVRQNRRKPIAIYEAEGERK